MNTKIIQTMKILVLALILSMGISYIFADWTQPKSAAPTCTSGDPGCDAPIHVGDNAQWKKGGLTIGGSKVPSAGYKLEVPGLASFQGIVTQAITITTGAGANKVLISDENGVASWKNLGEIPINPGNNGVNAILCTRPEKRLTKDSSVSNFVNLDYNFNAGDCGGTLPNSSYIGTISAYSGGSISGTCPIPILEVIQPNTGTTGVKMAAIRPEGINAFCVVTAQVIFIKVR